MITSSSQRSIPTNVKSGSSTLQNRLSVKPLDYSSDISGYHADFHEGHGTVGAWQGRGMACELTNDMEGERHGKGMGAARARHVMCDSVLTLHIATVGTAWPLPGSPLSFLTSSLP